MRSVPSDTQKFQCKDAEKTAMPRNDQVTRIFKIYQMLLAHPRGMTVKQIHEQLKDFADVTERTVRRDVDALTESGLPIESDDVTDDSGVVAQKLRLTNSIALGKNLILNQGELLALYLSRGMLIPLKDTVFYAELERVFQKIDALVDPRGREYFKELASEIVFEPAPRWGLNINADILETVRAACAEGQVLHINYESRNKNESHANAARTRKLGPHFLYFAKGSLYLVAKDFEANKVKVFSVTRILSAEMTQDVYEAPQVNPDDFFAKSFGVFHSDDSAMVTIKFLTPVAGYIKDRRWHPTQKIVSLNGGSILFKIESGITPDLVQWVLGFGSNAEVIEPAQLRDQVLAEAKQLLESYDTKQKKAA